MNIRCIIFVLKIVSKENTILLMVRAISSNIKPDSALEVLYHSMLLNFNVFFYISVDRFIPGISFVPKKNTKLDSFCCLIETSELIIAKVLKFYRVTEFIAKMNAKWQFYRIVKEVVPDREQQLFFTTAENNLVPIYHSIIIE